MAEMGAPVTEIAELFPRQGRWTEQDYYALPDAMRIVELAGGELIMPPPPTTNHQRAVKKLAFALQHHLLSNEAGEAFISPIAVRLDENLIREPDVLFVSSEKALLVSERGIEGPPDWVAEVLSPGTRATDLGDKLAEYEGAGVGEYWILDPEARTVRVYVLREGRYGEPEHYEVGQQVASTVILGFGVAVEDVL